MQIAANNLSQSLENKNIQKTLESFYNFCNTFEKELSAELKPTLFGLFKKPESPEIAISSLQHFYLSTIILQMNHQEIRRIHEKLYHFLFHPWMVADIHKRSFEVFLIFLSSISKNFEYSDIELYSSLLSYGLNLSPYVDPDSPIFAPTKSPIRIDKNKTSVFTNSLFEILFSYLETHLKDFMFFWNLLSSSFFPTLLSLPNRLFTLVKIPDFSFIEFAILLNKFFEDDSIDEMESVEYRTKSEKLLSVNPNIIFRLIKSAFIESKEKYEIISSNQASSKSNLNKINFDSFNSYGESTDLWRLIDSLIDAIPCSLFKALYVDYGSISAFYQGILPSLAIHFLDTEEKGQESYRWRYNSCNAIWKFLSKNTKESNLGLINQILSDLIDTFFESPSFMLLFTLIFMFYKVQLPYQPKLLDYFNKMDSVMTSTACNFYGVVAILSTPLIFNVSPKEIRSNFKDDSITKDCSTFFIKLLSLIPQNSQLYQFTNHKSTKNILSRTLLLSETGEDIASLPFLIDFVCSENIVNNVGLMKMTTCYFETICYLCKFLPSSLELPVKTIFEPIFLRIFDILENSFSFELIQLSIRILANIASLRDFSLRIPSNLTTKISISALRAISFSDRLTRSAGIEAIGKLICTGNPKYFALSPVWIAENRSNIIECPSPTSISAAFSIILFTRLCPSLINFSSQVIETSASTFLRDSPDNESIYTLISQYYLKKSTVSLQKGQISSEQSASMIMRNINSDHSSTSLAALELLCDWWNRYSNNPNLINAILSITLCLSYFSDPMPSFLFNVLSNEDIVDCCPSPILLSFSSLYEAINSKYIDKNLSQIIIKNLLQRYSQVNEPVAAYSAIHLSEALHDNNQYQEVFRQIAKNSDISLNEILNELLCDRLTKFSYIPKLETVNSYPYHLSDSNTLQIIEPLGEQAILMTVHSSGRSLFRIKSISYQKPFQEEEDQCLDSIIIDQKIHEAPVEIEDETNKKVNFFKTIVSEIYKRQLGTILATPNNIKEKNSTTKFESPISSYSTQIEPYGSLNESLVTGYAEILMALSSLGMFEKDIIEKYTSSEANEIINKLVKIQFEHIINVKIIYVRDGKICSDQFSPLFMQFIKSLGKEKSVDRNSGESNLIVYDGYNLKIIFEIYKSTEKFKPTSDKFLSVIWNEGIMATNTDCIDYKIGNDQTHGELWVKPLSCGLLSAKSNFSGIGWHGPIYEPKLINSEGLPELIRITLRQMAEIIESSSDQVDFVKEQKTLLDELHNV